MPLLLWHLLSLDAPTVACVWACLLAHAAGLRPSLSATLVLGLGTWTVYVADRLLDAFYQRDPLLLLERHRFARRHWRGFLAAEFVVAAVLLWLIVERMSAPARNDDAAIFSVAMVYFAAVHGSNGKAWRCRTDWLPKWRMSNWRLSKEFAIAVLFAAATAVPAYSQTPSAMVQGSLLPWLLAASTVVFGGMCWLNCIAIERWQTAGQIDEQASGTLTDWFGQRLCPLSGALAGVALAITPMLLIVPKFQPLAPVLLSAAASALLFFMLEGRAYRMGGMQLRVAADLALLTPVILLALLTWGY